MEESSDSLTSDSDGNGGDPNDRIIRAYQRVEDRGQPLGLQISQGSLRIRNDVEGGRVTGLAPRSMMRLRQRLQLRDSGDHGAGSSGAAAGADLTEENGEHRSREAQRIWNEMAAVEEQAKIDLEYAASLGGQEQGGETGEAGNGAAPAVQQPSGRRVECTSCTTSWSSPGFTYVQL
ncbi:uncharacterized protein [Aegilops tauschii subsp. strangulata]|uniref:uncharacterized protein n=1 Tax=Aegilops tauschii subsp. strangulata TaxID=200361 RepID=UPI003CC8B43B